jgi:hypothetical protein
MIGLAQVIALTFLPIIILIAFKAWIVKKKK